MAQKEVKVLINTIEKVKKFVQATTQFNAEMDIVSGKYVIDAKSILGMFSLDLSKPVELRIDAGEEEMGKIMTALAPYIVE